ncbi:thermonuclease family protein [uncultured Roseobacter sp.]|uniref:thermonuclease family protein n=1 Tax=uncultured Roseobacter sp. TaxID=114847 RepID=UPI00261F7CF6|nr:thermonuclease family protein [uncultured Roseobacter sp.]
MRTLMIMMVVSGLWLPGGVLAGNAFSGAVRVIDGDTVDVGDVRVRLHGIDAPETDQTCRTEQGQVWACGKWVTDQVTTLFGGRMAECTPVITDKYNRIVARCTVAGQDVGHELVSAGLAFAYRKYAQDYVFAEKGAAIRDIGLHASRVQNPSQFRQTRAVGRIPPDRACPVKGNISSQGSRIYHVPGQRDYERTGIRTERGERWFCSASAARLAGWRAAKR